jgi:putative toxin-antitoxin system antitoxin component (TIGR02293 family)
MEKRRSSRKSAPPATPEDPTLNRHTGEDEGFTYELFSKKKSGYLVGSFWSEKPADRKAFNEVVKRWREWRDPDDPAEVEEVLFAAERTVRRVFFSEIGTIPNIGTDGLAQDMAKVGSAVRTLLAADERAAQVFISRVIEGRNEEETARALEISKAAVRDSWREAKKLIVGSLKKKEELSFHVSKAVHSEPESRLPSIIERATEVIGDRQEAMRWLGTPVRGLDYATPISLLATDEGTQRVNDILGQIEHGVW